MLKINTSIFSNELIRETLETINMVGSRKKLGIPRWDNILDIYPFSGTVGVPIQVGHRVFSVPFYFLLEKINGQESLRVKPLEGDQYSIGAPYGFFGLHAFEDYQYGLPIMLVEGVSDWGVCKKSYKYTLSTLTASVSQRQAFFISNMTNMVILGYDLDDAGTNDKSAKLLRSLGVKVLEVHPPRKDWGAAFDSDYSMERTQEVLDSVVEKINKVSKLILQ